MARSKVYHTKQKDRIFNVICNYNHIFTIKDIYHALNEKTGLTTIYRFVESLVKDGRLSKFIGEDNFTYYQYLEECDEENHFFLKCEICGEIIHIDCDCIKDLALHINKNHKFTLDQKNIIINGICEKCKNKKAMEVV